MDSESVAAKDVKNLKRNCRVDDDLPVLVEEVNALFSHGFC